MTSNRNKPHFVLDDDNDEDSEAEQSQVRLPRIVVEEAAVPSSRASRRGSRDEEERHVGFAEDPETGRDGGGWRENNDADLGLGREEEERGKERHTYPPSSTTARPSPTTSNGSNDSTGKRTSKSRPRWTEKLKGHSPAIPESLSWVPSKLNWKGLRPVLRSTIASWCGLVLCKLLIHDHS